MSPCYQKDSISRCCFPYIFHIENFSCTAGGYCELKKVSPEIPFYSLLNVRNSDLTPIPPYFGWKFLSGRKNYIFIGNLSFWFFYIFFKLAFSFVVGLFIGPLRIFQMIREILLLNKFPGLHTIPGMRIETGRFQNR